MSRANQARSQPLHLMAVDKRTTLLSFVFFIVSVMVKRNAKTLLYYLYLVLSQPTQTRHFDKMDNYYDWVLCLTSDSLTAALMARTTVLRHSHSGTRLIPRPGTNGKPFLFDLAIFAYFDEGFTLKFFNNDVRLPINFILRPYWKLLSDGDDGLVNLSSSKALFLISETSLRLPAESQL